MKRGLAETIASSEASPVILQVGLLMTLRDMLLHPFCNVVCNLGDVSHRSGSAILLLNEVRQSIVDADIRAANLISSRHDSRYDVVRPGPDLSG
jgi:hypothetical protein